MPVPSKPKGPIVPFKYFYRPSETPWLVVVNEGEELPQDELVGAVQDLSSRAYGAVKQVLLEAKYKAEAELRDVAIASDHGRLAYLAGFSAYADYVIANFESWRNTQHDEAFPDPPE